MDGRSERIAAAARALTGVRFRPQGRDPAFGLDCVGLVLRALAGGGVTVADVAGYPGRGGSVADVAGAMAAAGLRVAEAAQAGDVVLMLPGAGQLHLGIATDAGIVHADAGLRRVVERPGPAAWPVAGIWRA